MSWGAVGEGRSMDQSLGPATLTITETPEGVATAISVLSAGIATTGPERSHPDYRMHPPLVEVGDETYIPPRVQELVPETDLTFDVPANYAELFVAAPLAYYLGASVQVGARKPRLRGPGMCKSFGSLPTFQNEAADLLRRVFFIDCVVRDVPNEDPPYQRAVLDEMNLDLEEMRSSTPAERLAAYMGVKRGIIASRFPSWHLSTYVSPSQESIPSLPFLLDDLSMIYLPEWEPLSREQLLQKSLGEFHRGSPESLDRFHRGPVDAVEMVEPELQPGDLHAWIADGIPIGAYTPSLTAYRNRLTTPHPEEPLEVAVVLNDEKMDDEYEEVTRFYRNSTRPIDVSVHESKSVEELAQVFESELDFVHYIGHCETGGLQCPDGELDVASLNSVGVRTFFLNACGSYYQGEALVERGSVAGAVTLRKVCNKPAGTVGTAFARLFVTGFGIERAMQLARKQIKMSSDYAVVGDGTYSLTDEESAVARLDQNGNTYTLSYNVPPGNRAGGTYHASFDLWPQLRGTPTTTKKLDPADVPRILDGLSCPVIFEGELQWADELAANFLSDNQ
jgi:hypothetical protein